MITKARRLLSRPPPLPWKRREPKTPLPPYLFLELNKLKTTINLRKCKPYNSRSYQNEQPPTLCPYSAAILHSLKGCTRSGLSLMSLLLREMIISPREIKSSSLFKAWDRASLALPILLTWSERSIPLTSSETKRLRTSVNQLQTDMARILHTPYELTLAQLPLLMTNYATAVSWSKTTSLTRLGQLRRIVDLLLSLGDRQLAQVNVDSPSALTVVDWAISRHHARITSAYTAELTPLDISPSIVPEILIKELIAGFSPQMPWQYSWRRRSSSPHTPTLLTTTSENSQQLYYPDSPGYQPLLTPQRTPSPSPLSLPPLHTLSLQQDQPTDQSLLFQRNETQQATGRTSADSANYLPLPPILPLPENLPISTSLFNSLPGPDHQHLMTAIMRTISMMKGTTT